jgi:hypothetical protein
VILARRAWLAPLDAAPRRGKTSTVGKILVGVLLLGVVVAAVVAMILSYS